MQKTGIEWADYSWNPVTGCRHGCEYCYARRMAVHYKRSFEPAFHEKKLNEVTRPKKHKSIVFCGSNCDLFGSWVPLAWIHEVMMAVKLNNGKAIFVFLTKNPARYVELLKEHPSLVERKNVWLGTTLDAGYKSNAPPVADRIEAIDSLDYPRKWISIEPYDPFWVGYYMGELYNVDAQWVVIGVRTNPTTHLSPPELDDLWKLTTMLRKGGSAVFFKDSIVSQMTGTRQLMAPREFPSGVALATKPREWKAKVKAP